MFENWPARTLMVGTQHREGVCIMWQLKWVLSDSGGFKGEMGQAASPPVGLRFFQ